MNKNKGRSNNLMEFCNILFVRYKKKNLGYRYYFTPFNTENQNANVFKHIILNL